jgi:hypothetical protein
VAQAPCGGRVPGRDVGNDLGEVPACRGTPTKLLKPLSSAKFLLGRFDDGIHLGHDGFMGHSGCGFGQARRDLGAEPGVIRVGVLRRLEVGLDWR